MLGVHGRSMMSRGEVYLNFRGGEVTSTYPYPVTNWRQVSRTTMPAKARTRTNAMRAVATSRNVASLPIVRRTRQKAPGGAVSACSEKPTRHGSSVLPKPYLLQVAVVR